MTDIVINMLPLAGAFVVSVLLFLIILDVSGRRRQRREAQLVAALSLVTTALVQVVDTIPAAYLPDLQGPRTKVDEAIEVLHRGAPQ